MNDLHKALGEISSIRRQVARATEFRGYGPATLATTGALAAIAAGLQSWAVPDAAHHLGGYLAIWILTAVVASSLAGVEVYRRTQRVHSRMSDEMIRMAVEQFMPSFAAGLLITIVVLRAVPGVAWMIPGLWQIIFSLGIFASCRFLPRPIVAAGVWYLLTGLILVSFGDARAFSPLAMGIPFSVGQWLVAGILWWSTKKGEHEGESN
ncbi:MAG TPA: hypothetical protein VHE33_15350 [Acidobacteriaceae bacterium]|nr:hypothetical protein [Acidobacteriaceae bacterium]